MPSGATIRLYYDDPYLRAFDARVVARAVRDGMPAVALDRSAFYPEGGGQPGDHGTLDSIPVLDTQADDGLVWHMLGGELTADAVTGEIDWTRRFDFMQQHHGQHLLSAAFEQLCNARTVSAHLGETGCTIDLDRLDLPLEQIVAVEELANRVIWEDHPVRARFVTGAELSALPLRKPPGNFERIRIVSAGDFDHSACGGTHPRRTGEVGMVVVRRWERRGDVLRTEFVCGWRVLHDYRWKNTLIQRLAGDLSVGASDLPAAVERIRAAAERSRRSLAVAQEQLLVHEAAALLLEAPRVGDAPLVARVFEDRDLEQLRRLARLIAEGGGIALLGLAGAKAQLVFARAEHLPDDMGRILREAAAIVGGRGGGRPEAAQGGGPDGARLEEAIERARDLVAAAHT